MADVPQPRKIPIQNKAGASRAVYSPNREISRVRTSVGRTMDVEGSRSGDIDKDVASTARTLEGSESESQPISAKRKIMTPTEGQAMEMARPANFRRGGVVKKSGLARLEKGEVVLPKDHPMAHRAQSAMGSKKKFKFPLGEIGTKDTGFAEGGPFTCMNCVWRSHYGEGDEAVDSCHHPKVTADSALEDRKLPDGSIKVGHDECCRFVRPPKKNAD